MGTGDRNILNTKQRSQALLLQHTVTKKKQYMLFSENIRLFNPHGLFDNKTFVLVYTLIDPLNIIVFV